MKSAKKLQYTLAELVSDLVDVSIQGDPDCLILGIAPLQQAEPGHITFLSNPLYRKYLVTTQASAVILSAKDAIECPVNAIISSNPYYTYSKIAAYFMQQAEPETGIHPTASLGEEVKIADSARISQFAVIGNRVTIGEKTFIGAGAVIEDGATIGDETVIAPHVYISSRVKIGSRTSIASGAVIGSDGFGFANYNGRWHKVPQLGSVLIGDDVDIGANTTIDRGAVEDTIIEDGVKLDNQVQVAHNVKIGANTIIAGCVGIAGSTVIGKNCMIGGGSCINGHIRICDNTMITGMTGVEKSIREPGIYSSGIVGAVTHKEFSRNNARFYRLDHLMQKVKTLETKIKKLEEQSS